MKIDLVYTWVDDSDSKWREKKAKYTNTLANYNKDSVDDCRFANNDELKYSLRSVEKNIPWINKIFIITDDQKPDWLKTDNEKIKIIDHKEIMPLDKLPIYNACAIENAIPYIKELSEFFIYANDDMFFWESANKDFFFEGEKPIYRLEKKINKKKKYKHLYGSMVFRAYSLACERLGADFPYFSHHNADPYRKSLFLDCIKEFQKEFDLTLDNRFRDFSDLQRMIVTYYSLSKNEAVSKDINQNFVEKYILRKVKDSAYFDVREKNFKKIIKIKSPLLCINDSRKTTPAARKYIKEFLAMKFCEKSQFEK